MTYETDFLSVTFGIQATKAVAISEVHIWVFPTPALAMKPGMDWWML